jgi:hypothetical protein
LFLSLSIFAAFIPAIFTGNTGFAAFFTRLIVIIDIQIIGDIPQIAL